MNNKFIATINPFRYRGYYFDTETNLYYLNSRYYDPEIGRFINADDISVLNEGKDIINGLNLYIYCGNNPIANTDEGGDKWWHWFIAAIVAVVVVTVTVVATIATGGLVGTMLAGAAIGGGIGFTTSIISQAATGKISVGQLILDTLFGAVTGLIGGSALGAFGSAVAMGLTSFTQSMTTDLITTGNVNYGKAAVNGILGAALGMKSGAQHGLTGKTKTLQNSIKTINNKIAAGGYYSLRGGKGALNLVGYHLKNAKISLKSQSMYRLYVSTVTTRWSDEAILKHLLNSLFD